jgi:hypothetical protein
MNPPREQFKFANASTRLGTALARGAVLAAEGSGQRARALPFPLPERDLTAKPTLAANRDLTATAPPPPHRHRRAAAALDAARWPIYLALAAASVSDSYLPY